MPDWAFQWIGYTLAATAALLAAWSFFADRARGRSRCRKCWYDLAGLDSLPATCPECSELHTKPKHLKRTHRRKRWAVVGMLLLIPSYGSWVVPRVRTMGVHGIIPTWALVLATPWMDDDLNGSSWVNGPVPDMFAEHWLADQMDMRSEKLSKPVATVAYLWFRWCEDNNLGSKTSPDASPAPLAPQLCIRFLNQAKLTRGLLEHEVISYCETFISEIELTGSKSSYPVYQDWEQKPRVDVSLFYAHSLPEKWDLEWQESRGGQLQPHWFSSRHSSRSRGDYTKWEGNLVTYEVRLKDEYGQIQGRWEVVYEIDEGEHLDRMLWGLFEMKGDVVRGTPIDIRRMPLDP